MCLFWLQPQQLAQLQFYVQELYMSAGEFIAAVNNHSE